MYESEASVSASMTKAQGHTYKLHTHEAVTWDTNCVPDWRE